MCLNRSLSQIGETNVEKHDSFIVYFSDKIRGEKITTSFQCLPVPGSVLAASVCSHFLVTR